MAARFRVVTYNVLTPNYCDSACFPKCSPVAVDPEARYEVLLQKLNKEISSRSIICLQEVTLGWHNRLLPLFHANDYHFIGCNYGHQKSGYMGLAVGIPQDLFQISDCEIVRTADTYRFPRHHRSRLVDWYRKGLGFTTWFVNLFTGWFIPSMHVSVYCDSSDMEQAQRRHNQQIMLRLLHKETGKSVVVGNYHMPCEFLRPNVMHLHVAMSTNALQQFAQKELPSEASSSPSPPILYVGDFNLKPDSDSYELMTTGSLPPSVLDGALKAMPLLPPTALTITAPMASAYSKLLGTEPTFTNYAYSRRGGEFHGCLDYIWMSKGVEVEEVIELPKTLEEVKGPLPTLSEPSDHLMLGAVVSI